jgi:hypothetical protein
MDLHGGTMANPGSEQVVVLLRGDSLDLIRVSAKKKGLTISKMVQFMVDEYYMSEKCDTF